jgi:hypothetical protein
VHQVVNPSSGKTEYYEDRRGLELTAATVPRETCGRCGKSWPLNESAERRRAHWVERQDYPGMSPGEIARNVACRAWALPNGFVTKGPHTTT